jgi:hypothetical protein
MFLKIVHKGDDQETRLECTTYEYKTDPENNKQAIFTLDVGQSQSRSYVFSKILCIIYIESDTGKTIDKFRWKDQGKDISKI